MTKNEVLRKRATSPFSMENQIRRLLWQFIESSIFRWSPRPFHKWRCFLYRCFGAKIGSGVHIYPKVECWAPWNLRIGNNVGIANGVILYSQDKITIGDRAVISQFTYLCTGTHDYRVPEFTLYTLPIVIGIDSWLAAGVFVHPGVSIGSGVVVGAQSVVLKNLPDWGIYAGNPCVFIKKYQKKQNESHENQNR